MSLMVKVRNVDLYSMNYRSLHVAIEYRGKELGNVTSEEGHVRARGSSLVDASLELNGVAVLSDVIFVLEDLAKGTIPIDTVTEVRGSMGFLFFQLPLRVSLLCLDILFIFLFIFIVDENIGHKKNKNTYIYFHRKP